MKNAIAKKHAATDFIETRVCFTSHRQTPAALYRFSFSKPGGIVASRTANTHTVRGLHQTYAGLWAPPILLAQGTKQRTDAQVCLNGSQGAKLVTHRNHGNEACDSQERIL